MIKRKKGFTLTELMVVIGILGLLAGLVSVAVMKAKESAQIKATQATIYNITAALENYHTSFGRYPPTAMPVATSPGPPTANPGTGTNAGIESLLQCLTTTQNGGPFYEAEEVNLKNLDSDMRSGNPTNSFYTKGDLFEIIDRWDNPLVYIVAADYTSPTNFAQYSHINGTTFTITPSNNSTTGAPNNAFTYQLWSIGPNGVNENGEGDDIPCWK